MTIKLATKSRAHICLADHPEKMVEIENIITTIKEKFKAVTYSKVKYKRKKAGTGLISDSVYEGYWYNEEKKKFIKDNIHILFVDIDTNIYPDYLLFLLKLQDDIRQKFDEQEAWITISNVSRIYK